MNSQIVQTPQPANAATAIAASDELRGALAGVLETTGDVFIDRPGFVASNDPVNPLSTAVRALTRYNCRVWAAADKSGFSPRVNSYNSSTCNPYLASIDEGIDDGSLLPPLLGGQCDTLYNVSGTWETASSSAGQIPSGWVSGTWTTIRNVSVPRGPLGGIVGLDVGTGVRVARLSFTFNGAPAFTDIFPTGSGGSSYFWDGILRNSLTRWVRNVVVTSVVRRDGGSLDCGNAPVVYLPPSRPVNPPSIPPSIPISLPGIGDVNVTVDLDNVGNPTFNFEGVDAPITVNIGGGAPAPPGGGGSGSAGGDGLPGDPTAVNPPAFVGEPRSSGENVDFGPPPSGKVWVGCLARYLILVGVGSIPGSGPSNRAYTQAVGNISLRYGTERGVARQVRSEWVEAFRPVTALQVTGVFVNSLPQAVVTIFPVAATICPENTCEASNG